MAASHEMQIAMHNQTHLGNLRHMALPSFRQDMDYQQPPHQIFGGQLGQHQQQPHQLHKPQVLRPVQIFYPTRSLT